MHIFWIIENEKATNTQFENDPERLSKCNRKCPRPFSSYNLQLHLSFYECNLQFTQSQEQLQEGNKIWTILVINV